MRHRILLGGLGTLLTLTLVFGGNDWSNRGVGRLKADNSDPVKAETSDDTTKTDDAKKTETAEKPKEDKDKKKPFKEVVPDATAVPGLIPLYRKKENLYAEIGSAQLDTDYIVVISIAKGIGSGWLYTGQSWGFGDDMVWQFHKADDRIQIIRKNYRFQANSGTTEAKAVEMGFADSIIFSLPIIASGPSGGDMVDLTGIFLSDLPGISRGALPGFSFAKDRSSWAKVKGLKDNVELEVAATYSGGTGSGLGYLVMDSRGVSVNVHYSISKLVSSGYTPRLADERVGYFNTVIKNFNKNADDNHFVRYINRWNLQKLEPSAETSLPKKPIVFWLEKTIPYQYRKPIRDGILEWNRAFERAGFYNAVEVRQQEDNDTWDPEDINYNTIRWSTANMGFAIGPSRVNPTTGEILDADVVLDVGFINSWNRKFELFSPADLAKSFCGRTGFVERMKRAEADWKKGNSSEAVLADLSSDDFVNGNHADIDESLYFSQQMGLASTFFDVMSASASFAPDGSVAEFAAKADSDKKKKDDKNEKKDVKKEKTADEKEDDADKSKSDANNSEGDQEKKEEDKSKQESETKNKKDLFDNSDEASGQSSDDKEGKGPDYEAERQKVINQGLKWVATHEVGHTLGLRHNFKLSTLHSLEEINNMDSSSEYGYGGSIMEYIPVNLVPKGEKQGDYYPAKLAAYDFWVINYGYKVLSGGTDGEKAELEKIAAEQTKPENNYATDEDCFNADPFINIYDLGNSPLEYAKSQVRLFNQILPGLDDRIVKKGESYSKLKSRFFMLFTCYGNAMFYASRYPGGLHINRDFKGDPDGRPPFVPVSAKEQREALEFINKELFGTDNYHFSPDLFNCLAPNRWYHWGSSIPARYDTDIHSLILEWQKSILWELFDSEKLSRMADAELRVQPGEDVLTVAEMFDSLTSAIFAELNQPKKAAEEKDAKIEEKKAEEKKTEKTEKTEEFSGKNPMINSLRRNLQREYFNQMAAMTLGKPYGWLSQFSGLFSSEIFSASFSSTNDVSSLARFQLERIQKKINKTLSGETKIDTGTRAHLGELSARIDKVLKASVERSY